MPIEIRLPKNFTSQKLLAIVKGLDSSIPRARAVVLLVESKLSSKEKILNELINDEREYAPIRHQSVIGLYSTKAEKSEVALLSSLKVVKNKHLQSTIVQMLGRIGSAKTLKKIIKLRNNSTGFAKTQVDFAASLISYRHNLKGHDLKFPTKSQLLNLSSKAKTQAMKVSAASKSERNIALKAVTKEPFGIQLSKASFLKVDCKPNEFILAINDEFNTDQGIKQLAKRKGIVGLYLLKSKESNTYSTAYIITSTPKGGNETEILLKKPNGQTAYAGIADHSRNAAEFSIQSVKMPGSVAIKLKGKLSGGKFIEMEAISDTVISVPRKIPKSDSF